MNFVKYLEKYHNKTYEEYLHCDKGNRQYYFDEYKRFIYGDIKCVYFKQPHEE